MKKGKVMNTQLKLLSLSAVAFSIIACGGGSSSSSDSTDTTSSTDATTTSTTETTETTTSSSEDTTSSTTTTKSFNVVDTKQTKCYDSTSGEVVTCSGVGYDADYSGNQPSYSVNDDGDIVTDNVTGLMWTQSSDIDGDGEVTDADDKLTYDEAATYCADLSLGGYDDWRVPNIKTLYSLIEYSGEDPIGVTDSSSLTTFLDSAFAKALGDTNSGERLIDGQYVSSTKYVSTVDGEKIFGVNFVDGRIKGYDAEFAGSDKTFYAFCVRGDEYGTNSYTDNGDSTITDSSTGLMWEQNDTQSTDFENGISICEGATTGGYSDWRMPNAKELESIVDYTKSPDTTSSPAIDDIFNSTSIINEEGDKDWGYYWSSTTHALYDDGETTDLGSNAAYVAFGRALGYYDGEIQDVHGAGSQKSNAKQTEVVSGDETGSGTASDGSTYYWSGPQGDIVRIDNMVRCVRDAN